MAMDGCTCLTTLSHVSFLKTSHMGYGQKPICLNSSQKRHHGNVVIGKFVDFNICKIKSNQCKKKKRLNFVILCKYKYCLVRVAETENLYGIH